MHTPKLIAIACLSSMLLAGGCTTVPREKKDTDSYNQAYSFDPLPEEAVLYVYRDRTSNFGLFSMELEVESQGNGIDQDVDTYPGCFLRIELPLGNYRIEATHPDMFASQDELNLNLDAGDILFYEMKPIARFIIPGSNQLIAKTKEQFTAIVTEQKLCPTPLVKLAKNAA